MLYVLKMNYVPNTASTNRAMAFIKNFSKLGIKTKVVFFLPDSNFSKVNEPLPNVDFEYSWEGGVLKNRFLKYISYHFFLKNFIKRLKTGDVVLILGMEDAISRFVNLPGVKVYAEMTEHPDVVRVWSPVGPFTKFTLSRDYSKIDGLFVISTSLKKYFISKGVPENKIHIVNMTVDPMRFQYLKSLPGKDPYVAYCGTALNNKDGVDDLIKSFSLVLPLFPNLHLKIIGKMPFQKESNKNIQLIKDLGIQEKVTITGVVPAEDVPDMLYNAQVLLLDRPNNLQAQNGFPTKLGEYLLTKKPVVVTRVGDIPLFLRDKYSALLAEPNDPNDFADKIIWALQNPIESKTIGENGFLVAMNSFNAEIETKKIVEIISKNGVVI